MVSEFMLQQTPVARVEPVHRQWLETWPRPADLAAAPSGEAVRAWGRLGYPRRARWLWEAARRIAAEGWPDDLCELPGVGRYTAAAVAAQTTDTDVIGIEVNVRRVCERVRGTRLSTTDAEAAAISIAAPLRGRDRLLALMDLGATVCTARVPACDRCPIAQACAARGPLAGETRHRQPAYEGSFRQRRGVVLAQLRAGPARTGELDGEALASLLDDGLAEVTRGRAHLPRG
jgi:A/G-specific adenine glycosylase